MTYIIAEPCVAAPGDEVVVVEELKLPLYRVLGEQVGVLEGDSATFVST